MPKVSKCPVCKRKLDEHSTEELIECMNQTNLVGENAEPTWESAFSIANKYRLVDSFGQPGADKSIYRIYLHGNKDGIDTKHPQNVIFAFMLATMVEEEKPKGITERLFKSDTEEKLEEEYWEKDAERTDAPETLEE